MRETNVESPPAPPTVPGPVTTPPRPPGVDGLEQYNRVAETVGMTLSLRLKDNLTQAAIVVLGTAAGAAVGWWQGAGLGAIAGGAAGMVASTLVSGLVLMVLGWVRRAKR